jgi:serine/threonine-protein kinase
VGGSTRRLFSGTGAAELPEQPASEAEVGVTLPSAGHAAGKNERKPRRTMRLRRCPDCDTGYSGAARFCSFDGTTLEQVLDWDTDTDPLLGRVVAGRYHVEAVLAEGGMGIIYRVRHVKLESRFAMKVLRRDLAEDPAVAASLIEEARATAAVGHSGIVGATDFGEIDAGVLPDLGDRTLPYFVMEYVSGRSLADVVRDEGALETLRVTRIVLQVASALAAAHKAGIVHRSLKPENIRLSRDELGGEIAKVLDFGVAKVIGATKKTRHGMVFGTPHYMSPEQSRGGAIDPLTDVYALGVILYECVTGELPFSDDTFMGVLEKHLFEAPPVPRVQSPLVPIVMRCLEKDPNRRFPSMGELAAELERVQSSLEAPRPSIRQSLVDGAELAPVPEAPLRWPWLVAVAAAALVALGVVLWRGGSPDAAEAPAAPAPTAEPAPPAPAVTAAAPPGTTAETTAAAAPPPPPAEPARPTPPSPPPPRRPPGGKRPGGGEVVDPWGR